MALCLSVLVMGCKREAKGPPSPATSEAIPASPRAPGLKSTEPATPTTIADKGDPDLAARELTQALRDYVVRTHSVPKDFEEFVAKSQLSFPPPPAGKKYSIKGQEVVLVKR